MTSFTEQVRGKDFDVEGVHLVEASAGTGKTYCIQTLYPRLVIAEGIPVQQLLVVTFTEAATGELRERLRAILEKCGRNLDPCGDPLPDGEPDRERIAAILRLPLKRLPAGGREALDADEWRRRRVRRALLDFDQASIFTIHGFCQRALREFAFECGHDFDADLISGRDLLHELCADWWRRVTYAEAGSPADHVFARNMPDVAALIRLSDTFIKRPGALLLPPHDQATRARSEQRLVADLEKTVRYAMSHARAIREEIAAEHAGPFFSAAARKHIQELLARLVRLKTQPAAWLPVLEELAGALRPPQIEQPVRMPDDIRAWIEACKRCLRYADTHGIRFTRKSDPWPERGTYSQWDGALAEALDFAREKEERAARFMEDLARRSEFFNKTDLTVARKRDKHWRALREGSCPKDVQAALRQVAGIKPKPKVCWQAGEVTRTWLERMDALNAAAGGVAWQRLAAGIQHVAAQYDARKRAAHGMTYDDMLVRLEKALNAGGRINVPLREALRGKYQAALIDEFQDTDPVQYRIFEVLFADGSCPVFFVGDPKQAIYSFRGGDIYTYCAAKSVIAPSRRHALDTNYRSQAPLVKAVNAIFTDRGGTSLFGRQDIPYTGDLLCRGLETRFAERGEADARPFKIWDYRREEGAAGKDPAGYGCPAAKHTIYPAVAEEIVRLLADPRTGFQSTSRPKEIGRLRPSDIAILVRRHAEAAYLHRALRRRGVPAIRQAGENVFDTPEAADLLYLLTAMAAPGNLRAVKTAWVSHLLPVADHEIAALAEGKPAGCAAAAALGIEAFPDTLDGWLELFREVRDLWRRKGFAMAFNKLALQTGLKAWLASCAGGERCLANMVQLQDLLHRAEVERKLGPEALRGWLLRQLDRETREENEAFETRLESDADAVRIMTVFKSKGLQFPVVFVPTLWTDRPGARRADCRLYHASDEGTPAALPGRARVPQLIMHLDTKDCDAVEAAEEERRQEDVRVFYVAATRASHRTYVVAGDLGTRRSVLKQCLPRERLQTWQAGPDHNGMQITGKPFEAPGCTPLPEQAGPCPDALHLHGRPCVDKTHGQVSFSSLAPRQGDVAGSGDAYDFDAGDGGGHEATRDDEAALSAFSFPAGARTGECWHRIFERVDFAATERDVGRVVDEQLALFRLDQGSAEEKRTKREVTRGMVKAVLAAELEVGNGKRLRLADIKTSERRAEMAFDFALRPGRPDALWKTLLDAWRAADGDEALFAERLRQWQADVPSGFMTGFIDLVFRHGGRYYLLDWKSNRLGGQPCDFDRHPGLAAEMARHAYFLQYLIYTVAVDRYLRQSLGADYDYDRHFGGVLYLFVRGIGSDPAPGSQRGIYYTKPAGELVDRLARAMMAP